MPSATSSVVCEKSSKRWAVFFLVFFGLHDSRLHLVFLAQERQAVQTGPNLDRQMNEIQQKSVSESLAMLDHDLACVVLFCSGSRHSATSKCGAFSTER